MHPASTPAHALWPRGSILCQMHQDVLSVTTGVHLPDAGAIASACCLLGRLAAKSNGVAIILVLVAAALGLVAAALGHRPVLCHQTKIFYQKESPQIGGYDDCCIYFTARKPQIGGTHCFLQSFGNSTARLPGRLENIACLAPLIADVQNAPICC